MLVFFFCLFYPPSIVAHDYLGSFVAHLLRNEQWIFAA